MHRIMLLFAAISVSAACTATVGSPAPQPSSAAVAAAPDAIAIPAQGPNEDRQWIQPDDFFVTEEKLESGWIWVHLAKMKQPPSAQTKNEALFFMLQDGAEKWLPYFYRTRPAAESDFALGNLMICFDGNRTDDVYRGPRDRDNARQGGWWLAKITDVSGLYKGQVTLAGEHHCAPDALRALVP